MTTGWLIAIEGIDGSGKTTQSEMLRARLEEEGREVVAFSFPRYDESFFGRLVQRYLKGDFGTDPARISPYLTSLPYACDRWEVSARIRERLARGCVIICNRYVSANMGHQGAKFEDRAEREEFFRWVDELEYGVFAIPRPSIQVWLDIPVEVSLDLICRRNEARGLTHQDIHETESHMQKARESFEHMVSVMPGWFRLDCCPGGRLMAQDEVAGLLWDHVRRIIKVQSDRTP